LPLIHSTACEQIGTVSLRSSGRSDSGQYKSVKLESGLDRKPEQFADEVGLADLSVANWQGPEYGGF
jgi:hypothetical protein